jgi:hypothetical protein
MVAKLKNNIRYKTNIILMILFVIVIIFSISFCYAANNPQGPDSIVLNSNTTKTTPGPQILNISGGYIASINLSAKIQDVRWKAFVGIVSGSFTLQDSSGATIYNWTMSSTTGKIYASRNSSIVSWTNINCSNFTWLNQENIAMNNTNANDNLTVTFNTTAGATHRAFSVGSVSISNNTCPTLNTFVNNASQDTSFEEMALYDNVNIVYATILESRIPGYNNLSYDFQMIVPENGLSTFQGSTAYYLYVELGN